MSENQSINREITCKEYCRLNCLNWKKKCIFKASNNNEYFEDNLLNPNINIIKNN